MSPPPESTTTPQSPSEALELILHHLLPLLLVSSLSVKSFLSRWRTVHSHLSSLHSSLSQLQPAANPNPLLSDLLLNKLPPLLLSLVPLSSRCLDPSLPSGKLHLQSDLDIAISSLSQSLHHLTLLLLPTQSSSSSSSSDAAIVLSLPSASSSSRADLLLFLRDVFTRLQIGTADLKQSALDSLLQLFSCSSEESAKISLLLADHCDLSVLVRLLDPSHPSLLRHHAASLLALLSSSSDPSRKALFEHGALGPLLRLLESGSNAVKEQAAAAVCSITSDPSNAWAVSAYGGVPALVAACRSGGSPAVRALAAGSLRNVCSVEDVRLAMVEEGAVAVLVDLLATGNVLAKKNAALCVWSLAAEGDDGVRVDIFREGGLERLMRLVGEAADPEIMEHALRAILALSASASVARAIASMPDFFIQLADLIRIGHSSIQQVAACLVSVVSPGDEVRRSMAGSLPALVKMLEYPKPATAQEMAANALTTLLTVRSNRKELAKEEKSIRRLVQMLDPRREEVCKRYPVSVVLVLSASGGCRRKLADAGACQYLQKLVETDVPGAKKALQRITGNRLKSLFSIGWRE
ncbi:uncharacterized protein M6B38_359835 [Iris pallida]|uniref:DUF7032 domain-containing protein n=1 Tax=Iris pallida TaxID=29817 RepID=A0AAX6GK23_IRIPA|nr:uncharacterized protein M6B38_359835 [Iris pallida]